MAPKAAASTIDALEIGASLAEHAADAVAANAGSVLAIKPRREMLMGSILEPLRPCPA
ncbi:hypothetical protein [Sphingomonas sp. IW22]|uniref:hypothetical protein n=1 Tax=Sphingomonas sp. IW22 TaxID=3242489 RepID=UPI003521A672